MSVIFDPTIHCGAHSKRADGPCRSLKGKAGGPCPAHDGRSLVVVFDPARHCGAETHPLNGATPCRRPKGYRTKHLGSGHCRSHLGTSPNGEKFAAKERVGQAIERAERAIDQLGVPRGNGDPFALIASAVKHAHGYLEGSAAVVREAVDVTEGAPAPPLSLDVALEAYEQAIRTAARTGKAAVDADVADRLAALDERAGSLLLRFVRELIEKVVPVTKRVAIEAWASGRFAELAAEYEQPWAVH